MKSINVTNNKGKYLLIPIIIVIAGIIMYFVQGFNFDIEFMGGIKMQVNMGTTFKNEEVSQYLEEKTGITPIIVQTIGDGTQASIKTQPIEEEKKNEIYAALKEKYALEDEEPMSVTSASASFGNQVQQKALIFTLIAILCILAYIAVRFEWRSAITAIIALVINIVVMMAVYTISYTPLNTTFIAAMLTVIGYSINNTIVVFDRIRENMKGYNAKKGMTISEITNNSINESMGRTINTTLTTLITIVVLYIVGVQSIKEFAFPLIVGVLAGAYSSIFIASPWWAAWKESEEEAKKAKK
jgi:preprotein translocase subunit SecF